MRTVYHGATLVITSPLVHVGRSNLDFGEGFYVTDLKKQAQTWSMVKSRYILDGTAYINEYLFDFENAIKEYRYKKFENYNYAWLHFIIDCRDGKNVWKDFDIIEGGVANDRVIDTIESFKAGQITEEKALTELAKHQPNNQICILNQEIVDKYLHFRKYEIIT